MPGAPIIGSTSTNAAPPGAAAVRCGSASSDLASPGPRTSTRSVSVPGVEVVALAGKERARLAELASLAAGPAQLRGLGGPGRPGRSRRGQHRHAEPPAPPDRGRRAVGRQARALRETDGADRRPGRGDGGRGRATANRVLEIAFNHRRRADVQFLRRYLDDEPLGTIYHARARWTRRTGIPGLGSWFTSRQLAGGGAMIDLGSHVLDIALHLLGEPGSPACRAVAYSELGRAGRGGSPARPEDRRHRASFEVEDFASALLRLDNGHSLQLDASWAGYTNDHDDIGVDLLGDRGGVRLFVENYATAGTVTLYSDIDGHRVTSQAGHPDAERRPRRRDAGVRRHHPIRAVGRPATGSTACTAAGCWTPSTNRPARARRSRSGESAADRRLEREHPRIAGRRGRPAALSRRDPHGDRRRPARGTGRGRAGHAPRRWPSPEHGLTEEVLADTDVLLWWGHIGHDQVARRGRRPGAPTCVGRHGNRGAALRALLEDLQAAAGHDRVVEMAQRRRARTHLDGGTGASHRRGRARTR